ncbi:MAG TPA: class F sortase [Streptosporangiaceae bacterium]|nr:class F sortase [Streptosporangiaceae bacterium]
MAGLEVHHELHRNPARLELQLHHEPPYLEVPRVPTRVRVPGFALRVRVPGPGVQRMLAVAVLALGLGITAAATAGLLTAGPGRYVLAAAAARPAPTPRGPWAVAPPQTAAQRVPAPEFLTIPAIGVRTRLIRLGLTRSGGLQAPRSTAVAGWYTNGPRPGAIGAAVIGGHVDSYVGPGVFFRLRLLHPGERIYVRQAGGRTAVFRVYSVRRYLKARFPTSRVYGAAPTPQLRLITCGGTFDRARGAYLSNVVVYATMITGRR